MVLNEMIYKLRTDAKMSQEDFAKLFDVSRQAVQKWENGTSVPELSKIVEISKHFDVSLDALALAKENARINNANINFINSDLFSALEDQKFDVIVSNPPYIKSADIETLQKEVKDFEPKLALDGGEDGLDFYRIIAQKSHDYLSENGVLLLECGEDQATEIASLLTNFSKVEIIKDYENIDRIVKAVK